VVFKQISFKRSIVLGISIHRELSLLLSPGPAGLRLPAGLKHVTHGSLMTPAGMGHNG